MDLNKIFNKLKSKAVELLASNNFVRTQVINPRIRDYGEVIELSLKSEKKEIHAKVLLYGEKKPIDLNIQDYVLIDDADNPCIIINNCTTSRQWITTLAENFLCGKEVPIPKDKFAYLKKFV